MSAGTKADSEGALVRPNQVNDQVNKQLIFRGCGLVGTHLGRNRLRV